jgi:hypothetical protein
MIYKDDLVGKFVEFIDNAGAFRIAKVIRVKQGYLFVGKGKYREKKQGIIVSVKYGFPKKTKKRMKRNRATETVLSDKVLCWIHHGHVREDIIWDDKKKEDKKSEKEPEKKQRRPRKPKEEYKVVPVVKEPVPSEPKETIQRTLFDIVGVGVQ